MQSQLALGEKRYQAQQEKEEVAKFYQVLPMAGIDDYPQILEELDSLGFRTDVLLSVEQVAELKESAEGMKQWEEFKMRLITKATGNPVAEALSCMSVFTQTPTPSSFNPFNAINPGCVRINCSGRLSVLFKRMRI